MGTVTIDAVVYNIYGEHDDATDYLAGSLHATAWATTATATQKRALVTAARFLDRQVWQGTKVDPEQALAWPREGVTDRDGEEVDDSSIPDDIITASYELAYALSVNTALQDTPDQSSNISSLSAGPVSLSYFSPTAGTRFPTIVDELVGQYLSTASGGLVLAYAGGTDVESDFDDCDRYTFTRGF